MTVIGHFVPLLAELTRRQRLHAISEGFNRKADAGELYLWLTALAAIVVLSAMIVLISRRERKPKKVDLLSRAGHAIGLSAGEVHDLRTIASRAGIEPAAVLLLSPANLDYGLSRACEAVRDGGLEHRAGRIRKRLFGPETADSAPAPS